MKTVKFKELPEKVQTFLYENQHSLGYFCPENDIQLNWLHNISIWDKATDKERLAYAEWKYPIGTKYVAVMVSDIRSGGKIHTAAHAPIATTVAPEGNTIEVGVGYVYSDATGWAEIVGESEKEEPKFKAGDMVEGRMKNWQEDVWTGEKLIYTGAKTKSGLFICEYADGEVACFIAIKKTDPDKKYKDAAKEMMTKEGIGDIGGYTHVGISPGKLESMLIEALKKGKEL